MPNSRERDLARAAAVLVTFRTPSERVRASLRALDGVLRIVVDNTESEGERTRFAEAVRHEGAVYEPMSGNVGIAAAQNAGIGIAKARGAERVLLLDDDTAFGIEHLRALDLALDRAVAGDPRVAGVGPLLTDARSGEAMWFEWRRDRVRFIRTAAVEALRGTIDSAFLIASGSLLRIRAIDAVGPLREDYFIDHVDREWGLRAGTRGWRLLIDPSVRVQHALGDEPDLSDRGAVYRHSNPLRLYFGTRNSLLLVKDVPLRLRRRVLEALFAVYVATTQWAAADREGRRQIRRGVAHALIGRRGPAVRALGPLTQIHAFENEREADG